MGSAQTKNLIDVAISSSVTIMNDTQQGCRTALNTRQDLIVKDCKDVNLRNVNIFAGGTFDTQCAMDSTNTTIVKQQIDTTMKQLASSLNQALNFNPGSTKACNITRLTEALSTAVLNSYRQDCIVKVNNNQKIDITCPKDGGGSVNLEYVNFSILNDSLLNCTQQTSAVTTVTNSIKTIIQQEAIAKVAPIFSLGMIIAILIIVFAVMFFGLGKSILNVMIVVLVVGVILIIVYVIVAAVVGWWPFKKKDEDENNTLKAQVAATQVSDDC